MPRGSAPPRVPRARVTRWARDIRFDAKWCGVVSNDGICKISSVAYSSGGASGCRLFLLPAITLRLQPGGKRCGVGSFPLLGHAPSWALPFKSVRLAASGLFGALA
jgi:hypothetical protein